MAFGTMRAEGHFRYGSRAARNIDFALDRSDCSRMFFSREFITAVAASDICETYYALCDDYPSRLDTPKASLAKKAVLEAAGAESLPLEKLSGPGTVFRLSSMPPETGLNVIVQSHGSVETDFSVTFAGAEERGTFALLCHSALGVAGKPVRNPPYPRPTCLSADELVQVMKRLEALVHRLDKLTG
ncbi:hypothetical protein P1X14_01875 [Sphingomonas sp. AOB5]|uniref:hypothetical protein n=1 Tax=Sphingomonas sp. AOB5 TaxID=3034017 RepID=UPI0023F8ED3E|nr:hypothetical protein [Sphingomonas sp. AOB5]MDF7773981.1 hypothetical protein [Sphingomonas sp. AOB5]